MQWHDATPLIFSTPARKAVAVGPVRTEGGQPVRRFLKELIRCGQYIKQADNLQFEVTPETIDHWVRVSAAYLSAGNKIPMPATHTTDPEANRGWVREVFAEGQSLFGVIDLVGDGIKLAGTCDVSLYSPPELEDGRGNKYTWPIVHVALCTDPVIPGLSGFVPIETSRGMEKFTTQVPVLKLQEQIMPDTVPMPATPEAVGGKPSDALKMAFKDQVHAVIDDDALDVPGKIKKIKQILQAQEKALGLIDPDAASKPAESEGDQVPSGMTASREATKPDPFVVKLARENYTGKLDALVEARKITPAARDSIAKQYLADQPLSLALSTKNTDQLDGLIAALNLNVSAIGAGEKTGPQSLALTRSTPVGDETKKGREEGRKEIMAMTARAAGLPLPK